MLQSTELSWTSCYHRCVLPGSGPCVLLGRSPIVLIFLSQEQPPKLF